MRYEMYEVTTQEAARVTGGSLVELAAGNVGVRLPGNGYSVVLALDMDDERGWTAWREFNDGGHCCDNCYLHLGFVRLDDLERAVSTALIEHRCIHGSSS
jgi:hypothetical protein